MPPKPSPQRNLILIKNRKWREGQPEDKKYVSFHLDPDVMGAEVRVNSQGYSVYFDKKETRERCNPSSKVLVLEEERVSHTEVFFNENFEEIVTWLRFTEWTPVQDSSTLPADYRAVAHA